MITTLSDTTASAVDKKLTQMRDSFGATTVGHVLTLLIITTQDDVDEPVQAAMRASKEHPSRVIVLEADPDDESSGLDAEIHVGRDAGAGEIVILRARGQVLDALDTLVMPLLLPDAPIVTWWPQDAPSSPVHDVLGAMSQRRITDALTCHDPQATLKRFRRGYVSGDSDLSWSRLTNWRGLIATAFEIPPVSVPTRVTLHGVPDTPSMILLEAWLELAFELDVAVEPTAAKNTGGTGISQVVLHRTDGDVAIERVDAESVVLHLPGDAAGQTVTMPERTLTELLSEELRRLDPDEVYGEVLAHAFSGVEDAGTFARGKPDPQDQVLEGPEDVARAAAADVVAHLSEAVRERGIAHLVLTGGTVGVATARALGGALQEADLPREALHLWWGDERFVPAGDPDRNDEQVREGLLEVLDLPEENVHPMPSSSGGMALESAAAWYGQLLDRAGADLPFRTRGEAFFDVLLLGMGPDGHIASLFPQHDDQRDLTASAVPVRNSPKPPPERISLSWPAVNSARHVALLVAGEEKAEATARAHRAIAPWQVPASSVRGLVSTTWYLDETAASQL